MKAKQLRQKAWDALKGRYWWTVLVALVAWFFGAVVPVSSSSAASTSDAQNQAHDTLMIQIEGAPTWVKIAVFAILLCLIVLAITMWILSHPVKLGYARFNMDLFTDVEKPQMNLLFSRVNITWKAVWLGIYKGLKVFLWSLLFIVPGIIAALSYSQSEYILAENPDMKVKDVVSKSKELMDGNKWKYFCFDLSYIGWDILAAFVPVVGPVLLTPYVEAGKAGYYLHLTNRLNDTHENLGDLESKPTE